VDITFNYDDKKVYDDIIDKASKELLREFLDSLKYNLNGYSGREEFRNHIVNRVAKEVYNEIKKSTHYEESVEKAIVKGVNKSLGVLIQKSLKEEDK